RHTLMKPNRIDDKDFGELTWVPSARWWCGRSTMADGTPFDLYVATLSYLTQLPPFEDATWDRTIAVESREALARVQSSDHVLRCAIAGRFLPLYARWNDGADIDLATFKARLRLESATVLPDGCAEVIY